MKFTPPIRRVDTAKGHHYKDADGRRVPGVTTILGDGVPKPALINWAASATADAAVNRWDELDALPPAKRLDELRRARYVEKDAGANRGTHVHRFAEQLVEGKTVDVPDELAGHVEAYARFLDDFAVKPVHVEFSVASYRHGYAGTGDLIAHLTRPGELVPELWLLDIKTNRSGIFGETALQLAAYRYAEFLLPGPLEQIPMPAVDRCGAVHVRGDGADLVPVTAGPEQHRSFLYAQQVALWSKEAPDLIGPAIRAAVPSTYRLTREQPA